MPPSLQLKGLRTQGCQKCYDLKYYDGQSDPLQSEEMGKFTPE